MNNLGTVSHSYQLEWWGTLLKSWAGANEGPALQSSLTKGKLWQTYYDKSFLHLGSCPKHLYSQIITSKTPYSSMRLNC